jgi:hypothetical protein
MELLGGKHRVDGAGSRVLDPIERLKDALVLRHVDTHVFRWFVGSGNPNLPAQSGKRQDADAVHDGILHAEVDLIPASDSGPLLEIPDRGTDRTLAGLHLDREQRLAILQHDKIHFAGIGIAQKT